MNKTHVFFKRDYYFIFNPEFVFILTNLRNASLKVLNRIEVSFYISYAI